MSPRVRSPRRLRVCPWRGPTPGSTVIDAFRAAGGLEEAGGFRFSGFPSVGCAGVSTSSAGGRGDSEGEGVTGSDLGGASTALSGTWIGRGGRVSPVKLWSCCQRLSSDFARPSGPKAGYSRKRVTTTWTTSSGKMLARASASQGSSIRSMPPTTARLS